MSVLLLEEMSAPALDALDRARTLIILVVSPLEEHGPHLPVSVDIWGARHFAQSTGERLVSARPEWTVVIGPTLPVGAFTFDGVGTIRVRQRVVRDLVIDYGLSFARAGFRFILVANGHAGPGHLVALDEAAAVVSRRHKVVMTSLTGHMSWEFMQGRYLPKVEAALGRPLTTQEREAFADDAHGGWWETSMMLLIRPDLVDARYRTLPPARYPLSRRLRRNYPLRNGGLGYVGHPAMADVTFARATMEVLVTEAVDIVQELLDGRLRPSQRRSPFRAIPFLRTNFWPFVAATVGVIGAATVAWWLAR